MKSFGVTHAFLVPAVLRSMLPEEIQVEHLLMGGEPSSPEFVRRWGQSNCFNFYHVYGPTECCVLSSVLPVKKPNSQLVNEQVGNIGYPSLIGCRAWIVDLEDPNALRLPGEDGEILIEGPSVARGYLNKPLATAKSFIQEPKWLEGWRKLPGRLYRTGDVGRCMPNGSIMYLGRKDTQIKIDGQRTELGEIEYYLRTFLENQPEAIADAITMNTNSTIQIVCFMDSQRTQGAVDTESAGYGPELQSPQETVKLRTSLARNMPRHMVPNHFILVDSIPKFSSYKVDRQTLKLLARQCLEQNRPVKVEVDELALYSGSSKENMLRMLWSSVLNIPSPALGLEDDFFSLGGTSAQVIELIARARRQGWHLDVKTVFENTSLSDMASKAVFQDTISLPAPVPFSLIPQEQVDLLCDNVAQACGTERADIQDVYPVSDRCEAAMTSTEFDPSRGQFSSGLFVTSEIFRLPPNIETEKFLAAWKVLISTYEIFKTRVIKTDSGLFEVVLKTAEPIESGKTLEMQLHRDKARTMTYGEPLNHFAIVDGDGQKHFIWTSKMLFDAWTIKLVIMALQKVLSGENLDSSAKITQLIKCRMHTEFPEGVKYFRSQFDRCTARPIFEVPENYICSAKSQVSRNVRLSTKSTHKFTTSTCISIALAIALTQYSQRSEIILSTIRTGRMMPIARITEYVGAVVEAIPMLVMVEPQMNTRHMLKAFLDNWALSADYEVMGTKRVAAISEQCTRAFTNSISLNILPDYTTEVPAGFEHYEIEHFKIPHHAVFECQLEKSGFTIRLFYDNAVVSDDLAAELLLKIDTLTTRLYYADEDQTVASVI